MRQVHPVFEALRTSVDACTCASMRKATRITAQLYDRLLEPSGLTTAQFSLLAALYYADAVPMTRLAEKLVLDRSTLTRTLAPLEREGLVEVRPGADRRVRVVAISVRGLERLIGALPYWQEAQERLQSNLGDTEWAALRRSLQFVTSASRKSVAELPSSRSAHFQEG
ncbi:MarR family winged helix-turn-helix transcriptional regulator [Mesorhizobium sp. CAU 1732]|uniref:MarR family winged helix-turn-helix transcriptional regulator n=1 Tax=Mesorhizobium sp. CAU 1732 TaxID=3140358 RepID=UPI00325FE93B